MRKPTTTRHPLAMIADDAIGQIEHADCYAAWFDALACSIRDVLDSETPCIEVRSDRAKALATVVQYLADDFFEGMGRRAKDLRQQLDSAEAEGGKQ